MPGGMAHWLIKSEPSVYSIDDMERDGTTMWEGVRNYQARNYLRDMARGDEAFFYHSNASPPAIVGRVKVVREAYPDPTQFDRRGKYYDPKSDPSDPRWFLVDVAFVERFPRVLSLEEAKQAAPLRDMVLVRRGRLSVQPVSGAEWKHITVHCIGR